MVEIFQISLSYIKFSLRNSPKIFNTWAKMHIYKRWQYPFTFLAAMNPVFETIYQITQLRQDQSGQGDSLQSDSEIKAYLVSTGHL